MKIYERDYTNLTEDEKRQWESLKKQEIVFINGEATNIRNNLFMDYPKAVRHYLSLFPNYYLDIADLKNEKFLNKLIQEYLCILNNRNTDERAIANHIKNNNSYFIIASILKSNFNFGHHDAFIIPEFKLGTSYEVDYLLIGKNSGGYEFVFIEIQNPYGKIITNDGEFGDEFRKGIKQVNDWEEWLEANYIAISETFLKYKSPGEILPNEFYKFDKTRMHYAVIAGRRSDFTEKTYRYKRKYKETQNILMLHYDNLYDYAKSIIGKSTY